MDDISIVYSKRAWFVELEHFNFLSLWRCAVRTRLARTKPKDIAGYIEGLGRSQPMPQQADA